MVVDEFVVVIMNTVTLLSLPTYDNVTLMETIHSSSLPVTFHEMLTYPHPTDTVVISISGST